MKQKFILLDIDNTLYDSSSFRKKLFEQVVALLEKNGLNDAEKICEEMYSNLIKERGLFYPEDFIDALQIRLSSKVLPKASLLAIMYDEAFISSYLYEETHDIIKRFEKIGELGIFSQGIEKFQRLKVKEIAHLFKDHHIHIVPNKLSQFKSVLEKYGQYEIFFLDDSLPILHAVKMAYPDIFTIWIKRGKYANNQEPISHFTPDAEAFTLQEAGEFIKEQ